MAKQGGNTKPVGTPSGAKSGKGIATTPTEPSSRAERRAEQLKNKRADRRKQYQRHQREWMLTKIGAAVVVLVLVGGLGYAGYAYNKDKQLNQIPDGVQTFNYTGGQHTRTPDEPVEYTETPPVGGTHDSVWQNCGYYSQPIDNWHGVHSLEHGAVWITYRPDLPQDQIDKLKQIAEKQTYILVSPYPDLPAPVVASAWNNQLQLDSANDSGLDQFVRYFRQGPQTPEPGAACSGGTSETAA